MKVSLEFNLPEEREEYELAYNGVHYACVVEELDRHLRNKLKHEELTAEQNTIYQEIRDRLSALRHD